MIYYSRDFHRLPIQAIGNLQHKIGHLSQRHDDGALHMEKLDVSEHAIIKVHQTNLVILYMDKKIRNKNFESLTPAKERRET